MALKDLIVTHSQACAMRAIYRALIDKSGRPFDVALRDMIAAEVEVAASGKRSLPVKD